MVSLLIYNPHDEPILNSRIREIEELFFCISSKYCFVTGSFLYTEKYRDIDVFVVSRTKKKVVVSDSRVNVTIIDFNDTSSLFYHSITRSCVASQLLPKSLLKVTLSDYWHVINEAVPTILNQKNKYHKDVRFLVLYTEYFRTGVVLDTFELHFKIDSFQGYKDILAYILIEVPLIFAKKAKPSYLKRFFYTQAGFYKDLRDYKAQQFLYNLSHSIVNSVGSVHG